MYPSPFHKPEVAPSTAEVMADALADALAAKGFAETNDLVVMGRWTTRQIETHGPAAVALAGRRAVRQIDGDWRVPAEKAA